jgi:hypothetical protein
MHLGALHEEGVVLGGPDGALDGPEEARPAGAGLVFGVGREKGSIAAGADKGALALFLVERARAGALGAVLAQDVELLLAQALLPFVLGIVDRKHLALLGLAGLAAEQA